MVYTLNKRKNILIKTKKNFVVEKNKEKNRNIKSINMVYTLNKRKNILIKTKKNFVVEKNKN